MTTTVSFGKRKYHLQNEMIRWCEEAFGMNPTYTNWVFGEPVDWTDLGNWCVASMFGETHFYFKNDAEASAFILRWK